MSRVSVENYEELVRRSNLVKEPDLKRVVAEAVKETGQRNPPAEVLGQKLIAAGLLTPWQNDKLMQGKHQGFFLGKYKLLKHLTSGGMSSVYLAEHTMMNRRVAIKVLPPARVDDKSYLPRFRRECQAMALLDHPNIVRAHDFDVQGTLHYMVLEYIDGIDLQKLTDKHGPVPFDKAADCIRQAALGLQHAHDKNFVHRDMKPANLMVDSKGFCKVLDLGVARITGSDEGPSLTLAHKEDVLGTADFLAPEQALNSHHVDHRADIYALGCTLYYMLTGHVPFREPNLAKKLMAHQTQEPPSITQSRPDCPPRLLQICQKMMAKAADDRYQTMNEVADDLASFLRGESGSAKTAASPAPGDGSSLSVPLDPLRPAAMPNLESRSVSFETSPLGKAGSSKAPLAEATPSSYGSSGDDDESLYGVKETTVPKPAVAYTPAALGIDSTASLSEDEASSIHSDDAHAATEAAKALETPSYLKKPPAPATPEPPKPIPTPAISRTVPTGSSSSRPSPIAASTTRPEPPKQDAPKLDPWRVEPRPEPTWAEPTRMEPARPEPPRPEPARAEPARMEPVQGGSSARNAREPAPPLQRVRVLQTRPTPWYANPLVLALVLVVVLLTAVLTVLIVVLATGNAQWLGLPSLAPTPAATVEATGPPPTPPTMPAGPADTTE